MGHIHIIYYVYILFFDKNHNLIMLQKWEINISLLGRLARRQNLLYLTPLIVAVDNIVVAYEPFTLFCVLHSLSGLSLHTW